MLNNITLQTRTHILNNLELFFELPEEVPSLDILALDLPTLTATKKKTYDLVKAVRTSRIGKQNVLVTATVAQLLQMGRAIAHASAGDWRYEGQHEGYYVLKSDTLERHIEVTMKRGLNDSSSMYVREWSDKAGNFVMSRATTGLSVYKQQGRSFVIGDVYSNFNRLRGGSWNKETRSYDWYENVLASERGRWHKNLQAFSFEGDLPQRVLDILSEKQIYSKYHLLALFLQGRAVRIHMTGSELSEAQVWEKVHEGFIYEMWRMAGYDHNTRPARTNMPLQVSVEDIAAIQEWEAYTPSSIVPFGSLEDDEETIVQPSGYSCPECHQDLALFPHAYLGECEYVEEETPLVEESIDYLCSSCGTDISHEEHKYMGECADCVNADTNIEDELDEETFIAGFVASKFGLFS